MKFAFLPFLLLTSLLLSSCASYFIRQDCEKTDWYKYGQSKAMAGERLSGDSKIHQCMKAGADVDDVALDHGFKEGMSNYCQTETVYQTGKRGDFFQPDMCDGSPSLDRRHTEGVRQYCQKANGFASGALGKKYNGICPKDLEAAFVPEFNRGRKSFLQATIAENENALGDLENQMARLQGDRALASSRLMMLPPSVPQTTFVRDPATGQTFAQTLPPDPMLEVQRQNLQLSVQSAESDIWRAREKADALRKINRDLQVEMTLL